MIWRSLIIWVITMRESQHSSLHSMTTCHHQHSRSVGGQGKQPATRCLALLTLFGMVASNLKSSCKHMALKVRMGVHSTSG